LQRAIQQDNQSIDLLSLLAGKLEVSHASPFYEGDLWLGRVRCL
jgi:hypothetical protein